MLNCGAVWVGGGGGRWVWDFPILVYNRFSAKWVFWGNVSLSIHTLIIRKILGRAEIYNFGMPESIRFRWNAINLPSAETLT